MGKKLYVGNISYQVTEDDLRELFTEIGTVESVKLITDAYTGQSRGFAFVEMTTDEDAKKAITSLNGANFKERTLSVAEAKPQRRDRDSFGGNRGPGRGRR